MLAVSLPKLSACSRFPSHDFFPGEEVPCKGHRHALKPEPSEPSVIYPPLTSPFLCPSPHQLITKPFPFCFPNTSSMHLPPLMPLSPLQVQGAIVSQPDPATASCPPLRKGLCTSVPTSFSGSCCLWDKGPDPDSLQGPGWSPSCLAVETRPVSFCPSPLSVPGTGLSVLCNEKPCLSALRLCLEHVS